MLWRCARATAAAALVLFVGAFTASAGDPSCLAPDADCTLRETAAEAGILVGSATSSWTIANEPLYAETLAREFSSITAETQMKMDAIQRTRGVFDFSGADALVDFAEANGMAIHGHNLVWNQDFIDSTPDWVESITDPDELRAVMTEHITTVVDHFEGRVMSWDVVNEPLQTLGTNVYQNHFYQVLGPDYIAEAFHIARAADPGADLMLNEIGPLFSEPKYEAFHGLVVDLLGQGVPIDGVGLQGHFLTPGFAIEPDVIAERISSFVDLGLFVEITELDIGIGSESPENHAEQRRRYRDVAGACVSVEGCRRITTWGFTDAHTWLDDFLGPGTAPLLFDESYERKPAYYGYRDGLKGVVPEPGTGLLLGAGLALLARRRRAPKR